MWYRKYAITVLIGLSVSLLAGCYLFPQEEQVMSPPLVEPAEVAYSVVEAVQGDLERKITGSATVISREQQNYFFRARGGRLEEIYVKVGDEVSEGDLLAALNTDGLEYEIAQQRIMLNKAQTSYEQVRYNKGDKYALRQASLDLELAQLRLDHLVKELEEARIYASAAGRVVYVNYGLQEGDYVNAFQTMVRIADPRDIQLQYAGSSIRDFQMGYTVSVQLRNETYEGEVVMTPANLPTDADESLRDIVLIELKDMPAAVSLGDPATISLILERNENTIIIPKQAVRNYMGRRYVHVLEDGLRKERDVALGIETATAYEIVEGLEPGEMVILR